MRKKYIPLIMSTITIGLSLYYSFFYYKKYHNSSRALEHNKKYYAITKDWFLNNLNKENKCDYFLKKGYKNIAIYGMGSLGEILYKELIDSDIKVTCFIDKEANRTLLECHDAPLYSLDEVDKIKDIDVCVVTPINYFEEISLDLVKNGIRADIISLEDIIYKV